MQPPAIIPVDDTGAPRGNCCHLSGAPVLVIPTYTDIDAAPKLICIVCYTIDRLDHVVKAQAVQMASLEADVRALQRRLDAAVVPTVVRGAVPSGFGYDPFEPVPRVVTVLNGL